MARPAPPDYGRDLGKFEGSVDVLKALAFAVVGILGIIVAGGVALLVQVYEVKSDLSDAKRDIRDAKRDIASALGRLTQLETGQATATGSLSRIESQLSAALRPAPQLLISSEDAKTIRSMLRSQPGTEYKGVGRLGEVLTDVNLLDFPDDVLKRFPLLQSMRYVFDGKGEILIASLPEQRVVAII